MQALYTDTCSCVRIDGLCSDWFKVLSEVRQGCAIVPDLFLAPIDWIIQRILKRSSLGIKTGCQKFHKP